MKMGLLLIDIQNDYFSGGNCRLFRPEEAVERIVPVLAYCR